MKPEIDWQYTAELHIEANRKLRDENAKLRALVTDIINQIESGDFDGGISLASLQQCHALTDAQQPTEQPQPQAQAEPATTEHIRWADAYAAFQGAFDTPMARRRDSSEYAMDARRRMREINEKFLALTPLTGGVDHE